MKAILILDEMPEHCGKCVLCKYNGFGHKICSVTSEDCRMNWLNNTKGKLCPLKPMPERKEFDNQIPYKKSGWNDCINEILGEHNEE